MFIPVIDKNDKIQLIKIKYEPLKLTTDYKDYTEIKIYKRKFVISDSVEIESGKLVKYYEMFDSLILSSFHQIFDQKELKIALKNDEVINVYDKEIKQYFDEDKVNKMNNQLSKLTLEEYHSHTESEDYDMEECYGVAASKLAMENKNNMEELYIIASLLEPTFIYFYQELYHQIFDN